MKKLILSLSIIIAGFALVACSKDKGGSAAPAGYYNGAYGTTPNDPRYGNGNCGAYPMGQYPQGQYYGGAYQMPYPNGPYQNGNCYGGGMYGQGYTAGSCDLRYAGRGQLCPPGYQCQPAGFSGICVRSFY